MSDPGSHLGAALVSGTAHFPSNLLLSDKLTYLSVNLFQRGHLI